MTVELSLPEEATLVAGETTTEVGQLEGRVEQRSTATWWGYDPATSDLAVLEWVVAAPAGGVVQVTARHTRAGVARADTTLG